MRNRGRVLWAVLAAGAVGALGFGIAALASTGGPAVGATTTTEEPTTVSYAAVLRAAVEVPRPADVPAQARGRFKVQLTEAGSRYSIKWKLTFSHLSGKTIAAHIHRGKPGKAGPVVVPLCSPCKSGQSGKARVSKAAVAALKTGAAYVNVHTPKNQAGEIRGQIKKSR